MEESYHPPAIGEDIDRLLGGHKYKDSQKLEMKARIVRSVTDVTSGIKFIGGMKSNAEAELNDVAGKFQS